MCVWGGGGGPWEQWGEILSLPEVAFPVVVGGGLYFQSDSDRFQSGGGGGAEFPPLTYW